MSGPLILIGASVRAAAQSARAAGFEPQCFDLFADLDTREAAAEWTRVADFGAATLRAVLALPPSPVLFTGAMENRPDFVDAVAERHEVWGTTGPPLRRCRDPVAVQKAARAAGFQPLPVRFERPRSDEWIWKPLASAGGVDIDRPDCGRRGFWQRRVDGRFGSATVLAGNGSAETLGHAWHGIGRAWPDLIADAATPDWAIACAGLAESLRLRGVFGVDVAVGGGGRVSVLEINPRWTASVELIERVRGVSVVAAVAGLRSAAAMTRVGAAAKRVVFARTRTPVAEDLRRHACEACEIADVPPVSAVVESGEPLCSIIVEGGSARSLQGELDAAESRLTGRSGAKSCPGG